MQRIYLVDGSGFIFRAYHALPPLRRDDGTPVGAVFGFCNMLMRLLANCRHAGAFDLLAVIFDAGRLTFRNEIYPAYKAHRPPPPEDLIPQFSLIREACRAFNIPAIEVEGVEADDIMATYAAMAIKEAYEVILVSSDKDLMQLIRPGVSMLDPIKNRSLGAVEVEEKFGVPPEQVIEVQALAGDSSDNIPGVPGIGPKTAAELIKRYGTVEAVLEKAHEISQPKRRAALLNNREAALISKQLVTLKANVILPWAPEELKVQDFNPVILRDFLQRQNFSSLITRLDKDQINAASSSYETITTYSDLERWLKGASHTSSMAVSFNDAVQLEGLALALAPGQACYIPFSGLTAKEALSALRPLFCEPAILKVGHNLKQTWRILEQYGVTITPYDDIMLMSYVLYAGKHSHGLEELALRYLDQRLQQTASLAEAADITLRLHKIFQQEVARAQVATVYQQIERPLVPIIATMEQNGVLVDQELLLKLGQEFELALQEHEQQVWQHAGHQFNIGSPKQLGVVLFEELKLPTPKKTKTGSYLTDADTLEGLAAQGFSIAQKILDWREMAKLKSTYIEGLLAAIKPGNKRIHTSFAMAATATGRLASMDPNLQNIPIRTENGRKIRSAFIAEKGWQLLAVDYSQIELRLLAHVGQIPSLIESFLVGEDVHARTAAQIFDVPITSVEATMRRKAKAINFGLIYGLSAYGLSQQLTIPQAEAAAYMKKYFEYYPGIQAYMEQARAFARTHGYVTTLFGRRCYITGIQDNNPAARQFAERQAINAPLQGSNADIIKKAMVHLPKLFKQHNLQARLLLQVHDELLFEVPHSEINTIGVYLKELMESVAVLRVPLVVTVKGGDNWGSMRELPS